MSGDDERALSRRDELLLDRALVGLDPEEVAELAALLGDEDDESFERAAAAIDLGSFNDASEPLPAALRARIEATARENLTPDDVALAPETGARVPRVEAIVPVVPSKPGAEVISIDRSRVNDRSKWLGWLAAAACLALALASWLTRPTEKAQIPVPSSAVAPTPPAPTLAEQRATLLASKGTARVDWSATKEPSAVGASGDVVWSNSEQRGYMRFHGLAANDPRQSQFQLWIFDASQDERFPIDGGVFDVDAATGDVIVAVTAKIRVVKPALFAVTVEKPGGVVVSKREHIVLTAAMSAG